MDLKLMSFNDDGPSVIGFLTMPTISYGCVVKQSQKLKFCKDKPKIATNEYHFE